MVSGCRRLLLLAALALLLLLALPAEAASQRYQLQRRLGSGEWTPMSVFTISRQTALSPAKVKVPASAAAGTELSKEEKTAFVTADLISYRAFPEGGDASAAVVVSVTPCSIIRGFDAVDSRTVVLKEKIRVVPGTGAALLGLQVESETNTFHAKMLNGDDCDRTIVQKLFPVVRTLAEIDVARPVPVKSVRYSDLKVFSEPPREKAAPKTTVQRVKDENGEWVEKEVPVDERTFLQKYWMYLLIPFVMSMVQNLK